MFGAWRISPSKVHRRLAEIDLSSYGQQACDSAFRSDEAEANARLIAAAPELLLALRVTLRRFEACLRNSGTGREFIDAATQKDWDLIAKAEGKQ